MLRKLFRLTAFRVAVLVTLGSAFLHAKFELGTQIPFIEELEYKALDSKFRWRGPRPAPGDVTIAAIDEASLDAYGRWPWSRSTIGLLIDTLREHYQPRAVALDAVFSEEVKEESAVFLRKLRPRLESSAELKDLLPDLETAELAANQDQVFERAIKAFPKLVLGFFLLRGEEVDRIDPGLIMAGEKHIAKCQVVPWTGPGVDVQTAFRATEFRGVRANLPRYSDASERCGTFNVIPDEDRLYRHAHTIFYLNEKLYPSLSLAGIAAYYDETIVAEVGRGAADDEFAGELRVRVGAREIPVDAQGAILGNFYGPAGSIPTYSIRDIIEKRVPKEALHDKLVFFGPTATAVADLRPSTFGATYPGVELHATVAQNVIRGDHLVRPLYLGAFEALGILVVGTLFGLLFAHLSLLYGSLLLLLYTVALFWIDVNYVFASGLWMRSVVPIVFLWFSFLAVAVFRYLTEEREKGRIKDAFGRFVSKDVMNDMLRDPSKLRLGGEKKQLTVFFSDIRGFTNISEKLDPVQLVNFLNEYFTPMTLIVMKHRGTLDKYMGDAIMAFWGAPIDLPDHAAHACDAALEMQVELQGLLAGWAARGLPPIAIGSGINTGMMSVGNMGSEGRFDYTVMGDSVNLGSRLEGLNKSYGTNIIISEFTRAALGKHKYITRELDLVAVKGKKEPVRIYELMGKGDPDPETAKFIELFERGIMEFRTRQWDQSVATFEESMKIRPDNYAAKMYIHRCEVFKADPPPADWDGVDVKTSK